MTIDLNKLKIFSDVVLAGSFTKAATMLRQPKSRVSRNIAALEKEIGVQLIYRTTRQFKLTQAGVEMFERAMPLLNELRNAIEQVSSQSGDVAGTIKVTTPEDLGAELMGKLCREFQMLYPKIRVILHSSNYFVDLVKESIDVAIRIGKTKDSTMIQKRIGFVEMAIVASGDFLKRYDSLGKLEDLESLPYLAFPDIGTQHHSIKVTNQKEARTLKLKVAFASNNFFALRSLAIQGVGVTYLPAFLAREAISSGRLVQLFRDWKIEAAPIQILIPHQKETPERTRKFVEFISLRLAQFI